jgi:hypothetical protein
MSIRAFVGTNPTGELITSGLPVIREEPVAGTADRFRFADLRGLIGFGKSFAGLFFEQVPIPRSRHY